MAKFHWSQLTLELPVLIELEDLTRVEQEYLAAIYGPPKGRALQSSVSTENDRFYMEGDNDVIH